MHAFLRIRRPTIGGILRSLLIVLPLVMLFAPEVVCGAEAVQSNLLANPSFENGSQPNGLPNGWALYAGIGEKRTIKVVDVPPGANKAVLMDDSNPDEETGITQTVKVQPGSIYVASVRVKAVEGASFVGAHLQLRFQPSNRFTQRALIPAPDGGFREIQVGMAAPPGSTEAILYVYTHKRPTPKVIVDEASLTRVEELPRMLQISQSPAPPEIARLKELYVNTVLARDGQATASIVAPASGVYDAQAEHIAGAIQKLSGAAPRIIADTSPDASIPFKSNLIVIGNRSTNKLIEKLYNRYYTLLDLRYPGEGGHVVRTLHSPFGDGRNAVLIGGSDAEGVGAAAEAFVKRLGAEAGNSADGKNLSIGWMMDVKLGEGVKIPTDIREFETWEASKGYGSVGYFGWNSVSKRMAMYYMTGDETHAREFLRLAFPDEQAKKEIADIDGERIENKDEPLGGPYHYNAHMMILFWDLIEESPVFTDEDRLRITRAFTRQLEHAGIRSAYRGPFAEPPIHVGSRHGQWAAISLYCLGRYFAKDYDDPIWKVCAENGRQHFQSLHEHPWVSGELDNHFWYNTAIAPILTYMLLTGDRVPLENGVLAELLGGQETLISGRTPDWALNCASLGYLNKAAYLTGDGRWLNYRERTGLDTDVFRLGQSFWPDEKLKPKPPEDLAGSWRIQRLPTPMWKARASGLSEEESFMFMSCRNRWDDGGDFVLIDGMNGSGRNPYHTFTVLELRLDGKTLLEGYLNQLHIRCDGLAEPSVALNAALKHHGVLGDVITATGEVAKAPFNNWRRTLVQRVGRYALIVDELTSRVDSENMEVQANWETRLGTWRPAEETSGKLRMDIASDDSLPTGWRRFRALDFQYTSTPDDPESIVRLDKLGIVLLRSRTVGDWIEMSLKIDEHVSGEVFAELLNYRDRGKVRVYLNGHLMADDVNHHSPNALLTRVSLGEMGLLEGEHKLRIEVSGKHGDEEKCYVGLAGLTVRTEEAKPLTAPVLCMSTPTEVEAAGGHAAMTWLGPAKKDQKRFLFSLITEEREDRPGSASCMDYAPGAAALALPAPTLAVAGKFEGTDAALTILSTDHLLGLEVKEAGGLVKSDKPVDVYWDFDKGSIHVAAEEDAKLALAVQEPESVKIDGKPAKVQDRMYRFAYYDVPKGTHEILEALPQEDLLKGNRSLLSFYLDEARQRRKRADAFARRQEPPSAPLVASWECEVPGAVVDLLAVPSGDGPLLCAAEGDAIHVLNADGKEVRTLKTDGPIRLLHWWSDHKLLLAGCKDEKLIAFDETGQRKWTFVSEMDPAVFRAAKTYWFKTAPGHEGIHGLHSGVFFDGKSQAFVGSACTLEVVDENGKLVKRMPQFWGPVVSMTLVPGAGGTLNLLAARKPTDWWNLGIINNKNPNPSARGFDGIPAGHTAFLAWGTMNHYHIFHEDFDGDGNKEVMSETNGSWNRVTVWNVSGKPLYSASFGPGISNRGNTMRDLDVADLNGDGAMDIAAVTSYGMLVALTGKCDKLWSARLPATPSVVCCARPKPDAPPSVIVGCEGGRLLVFDRNGALTRSATVTGTPTRVQALTVPDGTIAITGTNKGRLAAFRLAD